MYILFSFLKLCLIKCLELKLRVLTITFTCHMVVFAGFAFEHERVGL